MLKGSDRRINPLSAELKREFRLVLILNLQLIIIGVIFTYFNIYLNFWLVSYILFLGTLVSIGNFYLLNRYLLIHLCGVVISSLCLVMAVSGNLILGGIASSYLGWFFVIPIIAAATIGLRGLLIFSLLSIISIALFISTPITPLYIIPIEQLLLINSINHIFIFCLIFTVMYHMLTEYKYYESLLKEQNYLLNSDKQKFHYLSIHDSLTNLPNRAYFHNYLQKTLEQIDPTKESITLYFMDLNGFKKINDKYGHEVGDALLFQVGKRLQSSFRGRDLIARLGGDEFTAVIVHKLTENITSNLIQRIEAEFAKPFLIKNYKLLCSISIGTANYPLDTTETESLIKIADHAMYTNKKLWYKKSNHKL